MLKPINVDDIPPVRTVSYCATRVFAEETVEEFLDSDEESAEVVEIPAAVKTQQLSQYLRQEIKRRHRDKTVKVIQRKGRIYLQRARTEKKIIKITL